MDQAALPAFSAGDSRNARRATVPALFALGLVLALALATPVPAGVEAPVREDDAARRRAEELDTLHAEAFERLQIDRAIGLAEEQLELRRRLLGGDHPDVAATLYALADYLALKPDYEAAVARSREALAIRRRVLGDGDPAVPRSLRQLGVILSKGADLEEAEALLREALRLVETEPGGRSPDLAPTLTDLALVLVARGKSAEAEASAARALKLLREGPEVDRAEEARALRWQGKALSELGKLDAAEEACRASLEIRRGLHEGPHLDVADTLAVLVGVFHAQRFLEDARRSAEEALEIERQLLPEDHVEVLSSVYNLAVLQMSLARFKEAEPLLREVLAHEERQLGKDEPSVMISVFTLGINLSEQGRYAEAQPLYRRALENLRKADPDHPDIRWVLDYWGRDAEQQGDLETAEARFKELVEFDQRVKGHRARDVLRRLAAVRAGLGDLAGAEAYLREELDEYEKARPEMGRGTKAVTRSSPYPSLALVLLERGERQRAWEAIESVRGRELRELLAARVGSPVGETVAGVEAKFPAYPLDRIQATLPPGAAIVGWLDGDVGPAAPHSWAYVIRRSGPVRWVRLETGGAGTAAELGAPFSAIRDQLAEAVASPLGAGAPAEALRTALHDAGINRFGPLTGLLEGVRSLVLVPSEIMAGISVAALDGPDGEPIGDTYAVSYAPSATVYAWLQEHPARQRRVRSALLLGDPPFRAATASVSAPPTTEAAILEGLKPNVLRSAAAGDRDALGHLPRLTWSRNEVNRVAEWTAEEVVLVGAAASEARVDAEEMDRFSILHFATHALIDHERPYCSSLVLSQLDVPPGDASPCETPALDGRLTGREIADAWKLDSELVTLSACETALGRTVESGEGVVGFAYPFLEAGARTMLVSLWKVDDQATALLMERFYRNWLGPRSSGVGEQPADGGGTHVSKVEALQEAQRWLRRYEDDSGQRSFLHPAYWSAFVLVGRPD